MDQLTETTLERGYTREDFGALMKELRESSGFSVDEVSVATRISYNYVEALENGDFEKLPGVVFVKGFVKNLIKTYGVKDVDVIGKLDLVYRQKEQEHFESPIANENKQFFMAKKKEYKGHSFGAKFQTSLLANRKKIIYGFVSSLLVILSLSFFIRKFYVEDRSGDKKVVETTKALPKKVLTAKTIQVSKPKAKVVTPKKISSVDLVRLRIKKPTNFKMSIDHKSWDTMNLKPNTYEYRFDSNARFIFFFVSAVELSYNGQEIKKLGSEGQKKRFAVRKKMWLGNSAKSL